MRVVCAWCKRYLGQRPPYGDPRTTHGMCGSCAREWQAQLRAQRIRRTQQKRYAVRRTFERNPHIPGHVEQIKYGPRGGKWYEHRFKPGVKQRLLRGGRPVTIRPSHNAVLLYHPSRPVFEDDRTPGFWKQYGHGSRGGNPMARRRSDDGWGQYLLWGTVAYFAWSYFMTPKAVATGGANVVMPQPAGTIWYSDPYQLDPATGGVGDQSFFIGSLPPGVSPPWRTASQTEINAMNLGLAAGTLMAAGGGLIIQAANVGP